MAVMQFSVPDQVPVEGSWIRAEGGVLPHPVMLRLAVADDGRMLVTGLVIEADQGLASSDLRFRLSKVVSEFSAAASKPATLKRLFKEITGSDLVWEGSAKRSKAPARLVLEGPEPNVLPPEWSWLPLLLPSSTASPRARPGPRGHDEEFYRRLASAYRKAQREHPRRPIQALVESRGYSEPATHRQIREARRRGLLPPRHKEK